jgi:hypothetical protein
VRAWTFTLWAGKEVVSGVVVGVAGVSYLHDVIAQLGAVLAACVMAGGGIAAARFTYGNRQRVDESVSGSAIAAESAADAAGTARLTAAELAALRELLHERRGTATPDTGARRRREDRP